ERWELLKGRIPDLSPVRTRLGRAREGEAFDRLLPPLDLDVGDVEGTRTVRLQGRLEALARDSTASLMLRERSKERVDPDRPRSRRSTWGLKALFEHFVLAAAGVQADRARELLLLVAEPERSGKESPPPELFRLPLLPVSRQEARNHLRLLASELLSRPHEYLLPCEAVLKALQNGKEDDGTYLLREIERRRDSGWSRWSGGWGPVPEPESYRPPGPDEAVEMVRRRFLPLTDRSGSWETIS
ncbi:MAG: hypothetical protein R3234_12505, partial [Thermoanaerobaculia bacterium]|nr:hypothetical protein [Thermoanaerobaculia bacterium]